MCVQGYYASQEGNKTMPVQVESRLDNQRFEVLIGIGESVSAQKQKEILAYVEKKCKVKALLREDLQFETSFCLRKCGVDVLAIEEMQNKLRYGLILGLLILISLYSLFLDGFGLWSHAGK